MPMRSDVLDSVRQLYPGARSTVYLDSAAVGLVSTRVRTAVVELLSSHMDGGIVAAPSWRVHQESVRAAAAELVGGRPDGISFTQNTSTGLALVTNGLRWVPGDNVVLPAQEFPSNSYPWRGLRALGVEVREVPMRDGAADLDALSGLVDDRTRVVTISAVQYSSGHRYDLGRVSEIAHRQGALLVVDGTQAVGALAVDVTGLDVLAVSAHKWLLGPFGIGFVHLSQRARDVLRPTTVGWLSVADPFAFTVEPDLATDGRRFESGTENAAGVAGLGATLDLLHELGRSAVEETVLENAALLTELLRTAGLEVHRAIDPSAHSGIVIASRADISPGALHEALLVGGVRCSLRGAGVRFAPHYFSSEDDLAHAAHVAGQAVTSP
ncbi:hypothetical protein ASG36_20195 [Geodermatophilus sp. Leaf369]|nr:hypothetical protein ASG36_20195 [Geodermatophilus sp. Leaf369]